MCLMYPCRKEFNKTHALKQIWQSIDIRFIKFVKLCQFPDRTEEEVEADTDGSHLLLESKQNWLYKYKYV